MSVFLIKITFLAGVPLTYIILFVNKHGLCCGWKAQQTAPSSAVHHLQTGEQRRPTNSSLPEPPKEGGSSKSCWVQAVPVRVSWETNYCAIGHCIRAWRKMYPDPNNKEKQLPAIVLWKGFLISLVSVSTTSQKLLSYILHHESVLLVRITWSYSNYDGRIMFQKPGSIHCPEIGCGTNLRSRTVVFFSRSLNLMRDYILFVIYFKVEVHN